VPSNSPQSSPSSSNNNNTPSGAQADITPIVVGAILGGVAVIVIVLVVLVLKVPALRNRFSPMAAYKASKKARLSKLEGAKEDLEPARSANPNTSADQAKNWRKSAAPSSLQNTKVQASV